MMRYSPISWKILVFLVIIIQVSFSQIGNPLKEVTFPPCKACKTFIESFKRGMERTSKGKFEGGDAAWEKEKLRKYVTSELRLADILEKLCTDVVEGQNQCNEFFEFDEELETWWLKHQQDEPDIYKYFCIDTIKYCCPDFHYGTNCTPCEGFPDKICSNNGKCKGAGTRKGNGECSCDPGYAGDSCNNCTERYFKSYEDEKKLLCSKCHQSCDGSCNVAGPLGCDACAKGWLKHEEKGCIDVNECAGPEPVCRPNQFCVNSDGSFVCLSCDNSCDGCSGDGPDMCNKCAKGYVRQYNTCIDEEQLQRKQYVSITRYLTYLGMCVATCILLQRSTILAGIVGCAVAVYISVSEYMLNQPPSISGAEFTRKILGGGQ